MIEKIIELILKDAKQKRENAGFSGSWDDGGASILEEQVKFYQYGKRGIIPSEWKKYEKQCDEEYEEYMRLKKKFER